MRSITIRATLILAGVSVVLLGFSLFYEKESAREDIVLNTVPSVHKTVGQSKPTGHLATKENIPWVTAAVTQLLDGTNSAFVDDLRRRSAAEQAALVTIHLCPEIDKDESKIIGLLARLKSGPAYDKLSLELVRRRSGAHVTDLTSWIGSITQDEKERENLLIAAVRSIAEDKTDATRWDKITEILRQLEFQPGHSFEFVEGLLLDSMLDGNLETAISWVGRHDVENGAALVNHLMSNLVEKAPDLAKAFAEALEDEELRNIAQSVLNTGKASAIEHN